MAAFVTHQQKYEFNYLPFGVQSGLSYMCRLMDAALQGLAWETCMPYLDDVGIWSTGSGDSPEARELASFDQMMTRLKAVFKRLRWAGLSKILRHGGESRGRPACRLQSCTAF